MKGNVSNIKIGFVVDIICIVIIYSTKVYWGPSIYQTLIWLWGHIREQTRTDRFLLLR